MSNHFVRTSLTENHSGLEIRLGRALVLAQKTENYAVWNNPKNWHLGHYHGAGDSRLWVTKRTKKGMAILDKQVINYAHPRAAKAWRMLLTLYGVCTLSAAVIILDILRLFGLV